MSKNIAGDWQERLADGAFRRFFSKKGIKRFVYSFLPNEKFLSRPIFILGCGRSGTTILGKMLGHHYQLTYLNEPRDIWQVIPQTDIWSEKAPSRGGKLALSEGIVPSNTKKVRRLFAAEVRMRKGQRLLEKLPENSFRVKMITEIFPDALFINTIRNGLDVACSIERLAKEDKWWGNKNYKWIVLKQHAYETGYSEEVQYCNDHFTRGLLEWRMSVDAVRIALLSVPPEHHMEVRYEDLLVDPLPLCDTLEKFIGLERSEEMRSFALDHIKRKTKPYDMGKMTCGMKKIAGNLFESLGYGSF
ncbi:sulfotransferase [Candidatus Parcubacteria bacterium]|nr:MAG: sulfotransferase [Candidatus Parcubacteria bacterium]